MTNKPKLYKCERAGRHRACRDCDCSIEHQQWTNQLQCYAPLYCEAARKRVKCVEVKE